MTTRNREIGHAADAAERARAGCLAVQNRYVHAVSDSDALEEASLQGRALLGRQRICYSGLGENVSVAITPRSPPGRTLTCQPYRSQRRLTIDRPMPPPCEWPACVPR